MSIQSVPLKVFGNRKKDAYSKNARGQFRLQPHKL